LNVAEVDSLIKSKIYVIHSRQYFDINLKTAFYPELIEYSILPQ